jgi:hypothetical protein
VQQLAMASMLDGQQSQEIAHMAGLGAFGEHPGNSARDMHRYMSKNIKLPEPHGLHVHCIDPVSGKYAQEFAYMFLPHQVFSAMGKYFPEEFEAVFNTPSHHRVHHARNPRYLDSNYAGILIIWDRMFGTFVAERDDEPCRYGIVRNLGDFNILRVAFHEWMAIGRDLVTARSVRDVLGYLFGPPGWSPDGSRDTSKTLKARWAASQAAAGPTATSPAPPEGKDPEPAVP